MSLSKMSSKGQIVIPQDIREEHGLRTGTQISIISRGSEIVLKPVEQNIGDRLFGILKDVDFLGDLRREKQKRRRRERQKESWFT